MPIPNLTAKCRLHGVCVFLSASVPSPERRDEYERIPEAPLRIEEAVMSIARAIFMEGGTLVFGAHPSISPLVARVIGHYYLPAPAEESRQDEKPNQNDIQWRNPSLVIYQSQVWKENWAEATERLTRHPLVSVKWTDAEPGETVDPQVRNRPQALLSIERMRMVMIKETAPIAMIAIGGMKGVLDEAKIFAKIRPGKTIFTLATTGGAAALLAQQPELRRNVQVVDGESLALVRKFWAQQTDKEAAGAAGGNEQRQLHVPYALIAQQIVAQLVESSGGLTR